MNLMATALRSSWSRLYTPALVLTVSVSAFSGCSRPAATPPPPATGQDADEPTQAAQEEPTQTGTPTVAAAGAESRTLYLQHCAACHGEQGDGQGIAAKFLFPKPRDFRAGRFRLVNTTNGIPTSDDLKNVLQRGMPGSAMLPWAHMASQTPCWGTSLHSQYFNPTPERDSVVFKFPMMVRAQRSSRSRFTI